MSLVYTYAPFLVAFLLGFFLLHVLIDRKEPLSLSLHCFLAGGLGLGFCGLTGFMSLIFFHRYIGGFVFSVDLSSLFILAAIVELKQKIPLKDIFYFSSWNWTGTLLFVLLGLCAYPLWDHSHFYLYGGWDAWQTWNLKAKFIFLGGEKWTDLFDTTLWRSSPHYPLLLPLINSFGYILHHNVFLTTNVLTSFFFTFFTVGLLVYGLIFLTGSPWPALLGVALLTMPRFIKLSLSQYADIALGYYVLAAVLSLVLAKKNRSLRWALLAGIFLGLLSFTKNEGMALSFLTAVFSVPYLLGKKADGRKLLFPLALGILATGIWTLIFKFAYAPKNMSFINGLASAEAPSTLRRLVIILYWYFREFISQQYHGLWFICTFAVLAGWRKSFGRLLWLIPAVLSLYYGIITVYYYLNTFFPVVWWLQVSLHRIDYALIPLACFWSFYALWQDKKEGPGPH